MESIREKDGLLVQRGVLLHEVNHRAKNSIAMAIAMLRLQIARQSKTEVSEALEDAIGRLEHLARIHEILYRQDSNDVQRVDMAGYLGELCRNFAHLQSTHDHRIEVTSDADDITLDVDRAINVALIAVRRSAMRSSMLSQSPGEGHSCGPAPRRGGGGSLD
jgi:two-component sensor histidine kinase